MPRANLRLTLAGTFGAILLLSAGCGSRERSLGERIYLDGAGTEGRLLYTQGPEWLRLAGVGCVACHGERGEGLVVRASGVTGAAPAVGWKALQRRGYDEMTLRRALAEGVDPQGRELHYYMPRWDLDETELSALLSYLKQL